MSAEYVRTHYPSTKDLRRGDRLVVGARHGVLVSFPGAYLGVRFDGEKRTTTLCHPTWKVSREEATR